MTCLMSPFAESSWQLLAAARTADADRRAGVPTSTDAASPAAKTTTRARWMPGKRRLCIAHLLHRTGGSQVPHQTGRTTVALSTRACIANGQEAGRATVEQPELRRA